MDYMIECKPSPQFLETLSMAQQGQLAELFRNTVFFTRKFSCADGPRIDDLQQILDGVVPETIASVPDTILIDVYNVEYEEGSIIIYVLVTAVILPHGLGLAVGALGLMAADKFLDGFLTQFGSKLADSIVDRVKKWWRNKRHAEPPVITVIDPQEVADTEALRIAPPGHTCIAALLLGGRVVAPRVYQYVYQLFGCANKFLTVTVDMKGRTPQVEVA